TDIQIPVPIYVHLTYQSAFVDDAGKLQIRKDVYNLDNRTIAAVKSERGMIELQPERGKEVASSGSGSGQRRVAAVPQQARGFSFLEALFGRTGPVQAQGVRPVPPRQITR